VRRSLGLPDRRPGFSRDTGNAGDDGPVFLAWRHEGVNLHTPFVSYTSERVEVGRRRLGERPMWPKPSTVEAAAGPPRPVSAAVRFLAGDAGSAALNLQAATLGGSGSASWSQPISRDGRGLGWHRVILETTVPADASSLTLSFDLTAMADSPSTTSGHRRRPRRHRPTDQSGYRRGDPRLPASRLAAVCQAVRG